MNENIEGKILRVLDIRQRSMVKIKFGMLRIAGDDLLDRGIIKRRFCQLNGLLQGSIQILIDESGDLADIRRRAILERVIRDLVRHISDEGNRKENHWQEDERKLCAEEEHAMVM